MEEENTNDEVSVTTMLNEEEKSEFLNIHCDVSIIQNKIDKLKLRLNELKTEE